MNDYILTNVENEIYCRQFTVKSRSLHNEDVSIIAECTKNRKAEGVDDYYYLALFFEVGSYGTRDFLIGTLFGHAGMTKSEVDKEIEDAILVQLDDTFPSLVHRYLKKEDLMENWLQNHDE